MTARELRNQLRMLSNDPSTPLSEMERVAAALADLEGNEEEDIAYGWAA